MGIQQMLMGSSGPRVNDAIFPWVIGDEGISPRAASFSVLSDGTFASTGNGTVPGSSNWYLPTTTSIGNTFWVRVTIDTGINFNGGDTTGVWLSCIGRSFAMNAFGFQSFSNTFTVQFASDAAGANIVSTSAGWSTHVVSEL